MVRKLRSEEIIESEVGIYHVTSRCVRQAFLMGEDVENGTSYEERSAWLMSRLIRLAPHFKIDVISFSLMANHFHLVLRNRPDLVEQMSDEAVVRAWWAISPEYRKDGNPGRLTPKRLKKLLKDKERIQTCRERLSSISWLMRYLKHPLALKANGEDERSGHFFEGRFRVVKIESLDHLAHAMVYVDLNPVRAGLAKSIQDSRYTSGQLRYQAAKQRRKFRKNPTPQAKRDLRALEKALSLHEMADNWLSPVQMRDDEPIICRGNSAAGSKSPVQSQVESQSQSPSESKSQSAADQPFDRRRASDRGVLPLDEEKYLALIDIMGRRKRCKSARGEGRISNKLRPILHAIGVESPDEWLTMYDDYEEARDATYRTKVNTDEESNRVKLSRVDDSKTNQDAMQ